VSASYSTSHIVDGVNRGNPNRQQEARAERERITARLHAGTVVMPPNPPLLTVSYVKQRVEVRTRAGEIVVGVVTEIRTPAPRALVLAVPLEHDPRGFWTHHRPHRGGRLVYENEIERITVLEGPAASPDPEETE
jgi:hypothetical protein